jgi:hypothetical protein
MNGVKREIGKERRRFGLAGCFLLAALLAEPVRADVGSGVSSSFTLDTRFSGSSGMGLSALFTVDTRGPMSVVITSEPQSQVGYWGQSVTLSVNATGAPPVIYQWLQNGTPIQGATGSSLVLTNLQLTNAGNYSVVISNSYGSITSSNAYLTINPAGVSLALYPGITVAGVAGFTYGIQYNTNLGNTNGWQGITNVTLVTPTQIWYDSLPATQGQRFYRVVPGPISIP